MAGGRRDHAWSPALAGGGGSAVRSASAGEGCVNVRSSRVLCEEFRWLRSRLALAVDEFVFLCDVGGATLLVITRCVESQKDR